MADFSCDYSVLMSVYYKEKANNLKQAMDSIWNQTVPTNDFVLVCDGPLTKELDVVIDEMQTSHAELHVVRLGKNGGLGNALNSGITLCKNELVARMDSDDVSRSNRIEKQLGVFASDPNISICSGTVEEFSVSTDEIDSSRVLPEKHKEIVQFAKKRNPFNHPCVMYKKSAVEEAGGYQDFYLLEDYYLWVRMLQKGARGFNIQEPLLWMRAGSDMYKRRSGIRYAKSQKSLFQYMRKTEFISTLQYMSSVSARYVTSLIPNCIRRLVYLSALRRRR